MSPADQGERRSNQELVTRFLRAQNFEQVGRREEAVELYEEAVTVGFDSSGPYDRLIAIYGDNARHREVIRVAGAALEHVLTYEDKRAWYERIRSEAQKRLTNLPQAAPKRRG